MWSSIIKVSPYLARISLILSFLFLNLTSSLGNENVVDSLLNVLKTVKEDTMKVKTFLDISWEYHTSKPKQTVIFGQRAYDLSKAIKYKKGEASSFNHIGIGYDIQGELDLAMNYYQSALDIAKELKNNKLIRSYLNNVGLIHQKKGEYSKAMACFHKALEMLDEEVNQKTASILINNIGIIHSNEGRHEKALEYFERSLKIEKKAANKLGISMALTNIGEQYKYLDKRAKALICYKEAYTISESIGDKVGEAILLLNIGEIHHNNGLLDLAEELFPKAINLAREVGDKGTIVSTLNQIAKLKQTKKDYQAAIRYSMESLHIAREAGMKKEIQENFETLTNSYVAIEDFNNAFKFQNLFNEARDSLFSDQKSKQILELSTRYEMQRKDTENQLLKEQQAKNEAIIKQRTTISVAIAIILFLMSIIAFILFYSNRNKNKYSLLLEKEVSKRTKELEETNSKLRSSNKELERFAYIASHDLKEPLRNIMSFTKLVERRLPEQVKEDKDINEYMLYIINNTKQMHNLIEDVLEFSRIDNVRTQKEEVDLKDLTNLVTKVLSSTLKEQNVDLKIGDLPTIFVNHSQLFLVIKNLIENGIKYNKSTIPEIRVYGKRNKDMFEVTVADNGIGIDEQYQKRIFGMFKRLHNREEFQGSGLGLSICKKIIQNIGGDIWVESENGKGSKFTFSIPAVQEVVKLKNPKEEKAELIS